MEHSIKHLEESMQESTLLPAGTPHAVAQAVAALRDGQVVALPTDTVYGLAAHAFLPEAVARLYAVKKRPAEMAVPLLLPRASALPGVCDAIPATAWTLADRFWPGALTMVLRRAPIVPDVVTNRRPSVAVRVPDHALVRDICLHLGAPLAVTSANLHGTPAASTAEKVAVTLGDQVPLIVDGGPSPGGVPSTVVDLTVSPSAILRTGPIAADALASLLGEVVVGGAFWEER
jgi:L-threonylcarbamoyladenylate synthase